MARILGAPSEKSPDWLTAFVVMVSMVTPGRVCVGGKGDTISFLLIKFAKFYI